ncbi:MAG: L-serine ammonia-lyase, iron-sulfur-dependent subunit beta [Clostridiales bacterium]|nr:L-serine ammonia-lyase, iron-sulfur-dependent subunit beta [Clostridiales bacterium]MDY5348587.1 L-serine ammonia-lyase, iron-sulfur-dependent subunit beta [Candidatus Ventricola sp.]MDY5513697.1 L-serine ammonia-lyase, iron-sulfur-dependent subunit beta [Candidatus Ventricola sp.]
MNLFDILGPVMVGPSSSHTAGAVRIGRIARRLLGEDTPERAEIGLSGSFAATGHGHGTDRAIVAGLLGMQPSDERIAVSFDIARQEGMDFSFSRATLPGEHPNTARIALTGRSGKTLTIVASSLGGGRIMVVEMNGLRANFSGDLPTLIVQNRDQPGHVSEVTSMLAHKGVNIATMQLYRDYPGGNAVMIIETDKAVPPEGIDWLERSEGITRVTFVDAEKAR